MWMLNRRWCTSSLETTTKHGLDLSTPIITPIITPINTNWNGSQGMRTSAKTYLSLPSSRRILRSFDITANHQEVKQSKDGACLHPIPSEVIHSISYTLHWPLILQKLKQLEDLASTARRAENTCLEGSIT